MSSEASVATPSLLLSGFEKPLNTRPQYRHTINSDTLTVAKFYEVSNLLLENPNLNSSHLFRADILHDSSGDLKTKAQRERLLPSECSHGLDAIRPEEPITACEHPTDLNGFSPHRTVIRRLIPRNQNLDRPLEQSCFFYQLDGGLHVVVYVPHIDNNDHMPWYHPKVRALAYAFEPGEGGKQAAISLWSIPFDETPEESETDQRLHRTLLALGSTFLRLSKYQSPSARSASGKATSEPKAKSDGELDLRPSAIKDTIVPQHTVQDTYAHLKTQYAPHLIASWVEATPPDKHVFEDLAIAAFLLCLWVKVYGSPSNFTGFVDIACGNGLLVYILNKEGWPGWGLDARRRKTWDALDIGNRVVEQIIVPKPFLDLLDSEANGENGELSHEANTKFHNGIFPAGTFIISNHADELTAWTPLLSALSCPATPLPFLNIPCCSHALSGGKHRYTPKEASLTIPTSTNTDSNGPPASTASANAAATNNATTNADSNPDEQSAEGDLKALRTTRAKERTGTDDKSMYACLTRKTVQLSRQLSIPITCTLMRIPSTRNVGVVNFSLHSCDSDTDVVATTGEWRAAKVRELVERECVRSGGGKKSAEVWVERARSLHAGKGRGKVNWGGAGAVGAAGAAGKGMGSERTTRASEQDGGSLVGEADLDLSGLSMTDVLVTAKDREGAS